MAHNYYDILGVANTATIEEIRKAFRVKAKQYHPDVNSQPNANEQFRKVSEAYEVLTDAQRRYLFDLQLQSSSFKETKRKVHPRAYGSAKAQAETSFHYDWESISRAAALKRKQKEETYIFRANGPMLQFLYVFSMFIGFVVVSINIWCISLGYWPKASLFGSIPAVFMVKEGWQGVVGQKTWLSSMMRRKRK